VLDRYKRAYELDVGKTVGRAAANQPLREGLEATTLQSVAGGAGPVSFDLTVRRGASGALRAYLSPTQVGHTEGEQARAVAGMIVGRLSSRTKMALGLSQSAQVLQQRLSGQFGQAFLVAEEPLSRAGFRSAQSASVAIRHALGPIAVSVASERGREWLPGPSPGLARSAYRNLSVAIVGRSGRASYALGVTRHNESDSVLGSRFSATLLAGGADTTFVDGSVRFDLGRGWRTDGSYRRGWTRASGGSPAQSGSLVTDGFAASVAKTGLLASQDRLGFRLSQPLRVRGGGLGLYLPVDYSYATQTAAYDNRNMRLTPSGRELDYEVAYGFGMWGGQVDLNAFVRTDPGHISGERRDTGGAIRFKVGL
jgi:hypothetical protein